MAKLLVVSAVAVFFVGAAIALALPSIESEPENPFIKKYPSKALVAMSEKGEPQFVVVGGEELGRAGFQNLFNFTAYLEGRPQNQTAINFIPLITVLSGISG